MAASKGKTLLKKSLFKTQNKSPWPGKSRCRSRSKASSTMVYLLSSSTEWSNYRSRCRLCLLSRAFCLLRMSMQAICTHRYSNLVKRSIKTSSRMRTPMRVRRIARASSWLAKIRKTSTKEGNLSSWGTMRHRSCATTSARCAMFSSNLLLWPSNLHSCWSVKKIYR